MKAERESFDPAKWSTFASTSDDSVIEVFSFILLSYHTIAALAEHRSSWKLQIYGTVDNQCLIPEPLPALHAWPSLFLTLPPTNWRAFALLLASRCSQLRS